MEDGLLVHHAIAIRVFENADAVARRTIIAARLQHAAFLPGLGGEQSAAIGIFRRLRDPESSARVPLHGDGFVDQRFSGHDAGPEARLHLKLLDGVHRPERPTFWIAQCCQIGLGTQFIHVLPSSGPEDCAEDEAANARVFQRGVGALKEPGRAMFWAFEGPHLRLDVVNGSTGAADVLLLLFRASQVGPGVCDLWGEGRSKHEYVIGEREVVKSLVIQIEERCVANDGMRIRPDIEHHAAGEALALGGIPGAPESRLAPGHIAGRDCSRHGHDATAALGECGESRLGFGGEWREFAAVEQHYIHLRELRGIRRRGGRDHNSALLQNRGIVGAKGLRITADENTQGGGG